MEETVIKDGKKLRLGYTTGSCAAAAAKAAAWMLLTGKRKENISLATPKGILLNLQVYDIDMQSDYVSCSIEKDSGDDPDVTKGTHIFARVEYAEDSSKASEDEINAMVSYGAFTSDDQKTECRRDDGSGMTFGTGKKEIEKVEIIIEGGQGIGRVTKPGLDQPVGNAAINSVPRKMIKENVEEVCEAADYTGTLRITISSPEGESLAEKTFNPRLGIIGGISILGTTGIVEPMSEESIIETIRIELRQKKEQGEKYALLTPGNYGIDFIRDGLLLDPRQAVMVSNFIGDSLAYCGELGFEGVLLIGHIGKLVKLAAGMMNTHSKYGDCRMEIIAANAAAAGLDSAGTGRILECVTCDDALKLIREADAVSSVQPGEGIYGKTLERLSRRIEFMINQKLAAVCAEQAKSAAIVFSRESGFLCETANAGELLEHFK